MAAVLGFGEEVNLMSGDLLHRLAAEQAPEAAKVHGKNAETEDADVRALRVDFQSR